MNGPTQKQILSEGILLCVLSVLKQRMGLKMVNTLEQGPTDITNRNCIVLCRCNDTIEAYFI